MGKLPAYLHYAKDWLTDPNLSRCSKASKGVWQDVLDVMFLNAVRGVACNADGSPWSDEELARAIGGDISENLHSLSELLAKGVASRNNRNAIFSRRMVLDEQERQSNRERQIKHRNKVVTPSVTPLSGTATVTALAVDVDVGFKEKDAALIYEAYPRKIARSAALKSIIHALIRLSSGKESPPGLTLTRGDSIVWLIQRTRLYANSPAGNAGEFTPHPTTWFNQSRYLDDESEWSKHGSEPSKSEHRSNTRRRNLVDAFRSEAPANDGRRGGERESRAVDESGP